MNHSINILAFLICLFDTLTAQRLFKQVLFPKSVWPQFVYKTSILQINSKIECSAVCQTELANCNVFFFDETTRICRLGNLDLKTNIIGTQNDAVGFAEYDYLKNQMKNYIFIKPNVVSTAWQSHIYRSVNMSGYPSDSINCMNECLNVDITVCTMFVFENFICYLGRVDFLTGTVSERLSSVTLYTVIRDCNDVALVGDNTKLTVYINHSPVQVLCRTGGWTVIQSRGQFGNAPDYFYKTWAEYQNPFGTAGQEFWLGLDNMYLLTQKKKYTLRVTLVTFSGTTQVAYYSTFKILDNTYYTLNAAGFSGAANDALTQHNGYRFTTKDRDNDAWSGNCAIQYIGGWWFTACHPSNLNGYNLGSGSVNNWLTISWDPLSGPYTSLSSVEMAVQSLI